MEADAKCVFIGQIMSWFYNTVAHCQLFKFITKILRQKSNCKQNSHRATLPRRAVCFVISLIFFLENDLCLPVKISPVCTWKIPFRNGALIELSGTTKGNEFVFN